MKAMTELLACPFCGGAGSLIISDQTEFAQVECATEGCAAGSCVQDTPDLAIAAWNRRAALAPAADAQRGDACPLDGPFRVISSEAEERDVVVDRDDFIIYDANSKRSAEWVCAALNAALRHDGTADRAKGDLRAVAELQAENKRLAEALAAEREACCKDVCPFCADGKPMEGAEWHAWDRPNVVDGMMRYTVACKAAAIRARAAAKSGEGKDNG